MHPSKRVRDAYRAKLPTELSIQVDDHVVVEMEDDSGSWSYGALAHDAFQSGWFPTACLSPSTPVEASSRRCELLPRTRALAESR